MGTKKNITLGTYGNYDNSLYPFVYELEEEI